LLDVLPEGATDPGVTGAIITAQYFIEQYAPMIQTGDTAIWDALSTDQCAYCADASDWARTAASDGFVVSGGEIHVDESRTRGSIVDDEWTTAVLGLVVAQDAIQVDRPGSEDDSVVKATETGLVIGLVFADDRWLVDGVNPVDEKEIRG